LSEVVEMREFLAGGFGSEALAVLPDKGKAKVGEMEGRARQGRRSISLVGLAFLGLVGAQISGAEIDIEQVGAAGKMKGPGLRGEPLALFEDVGDVFAGEGLAVEGILGGAGEVGVQAVHVQKFTVAYCVQCGPPQLEIIRIVNCLIEKVRTVGGYMAVS
jgi:hypothetical protein